MPVAEPSPSSAAFKERLAGLINEIHGARDVSEIIVGLTQRIVELLNSERATIYAVDPASGEIFSLYKEGNDVKEIRVRRDANSMVGFAALTGQTLVIENAYDPAELKRHHPQLRFDSQWDRLSHFITRQVLTTPIVYDKYLMGVLQLLNRKAGKSFSAEDTAAAGEIAKTLGIAFYNRRQVRRPQHNKYGALLDKGLITEKNFHEAVSFARMNNAHVSHVLVDRYGVSREEVLKSLAAFFGCPYFHYDGRQRMPADLCQRLDPEVLRTLVIAPLQVEGGVLRAAVADPSNLAVSDALRAMKLGDRLELSVALEQDVLDLIGASFGTPHDGGARGGVDEIMGQLSEEAAVEAAAGETGEVLGENDNAVVRLANQMILDAYAQGASDIHVEPSGRDAPTRIRFRVDGECRTYQEIPAGHRRALVARLKIMAELDIAERRKPQDGKIRFKTRRGIIELRVATIPTAGENEDVVMRLLAASKPIPIDRMDFAPRNLVLLKECVSKPYGLILCVGPTGSGKTTTLHSALGFINTPDVKIWTAEDPVEITQPGLRQVQVHPRIGFSFATAMRSFLRADPDVIMVGEMRDEETASIAVEASLTGHLVLSTLHTNSAPETITRLVDMNVDPLSFADSLLCVLAQRLARRLCKSCKTAYAPSREDLDNLAVMYGGAEALAKDGVRAEGPLYRAKGCAECSGTGYKGRVALHELLVSTDAVKHLIQTRTFSELRKQVIADGMVTLLKDGLQKVLQGLTDVAQVRAVCLK